MKALAGKLPLFWIMGIRGIVKVILCLICCAYLRLSPFGPREKRLMLLFRGLMGTGNVITYYFAIGNLLLSEAVVLSFTNPVFTAIFAVAFLKERMSKFDIAGGNSI
jgi:drug/metabolite transporter (DMT)-like permease